VGVVDLLEVAEGLVAENKFLSKNLSTVLN
jgi:hypothetical protein